MSRDVLGVRRGWVVCCLHQVGRDQGCFWTTCNARGIYSKTSSASNVSKAMVEKFKTRETSKLFALVMMGQ